MKLSQIKLVATFGIVAAAALLQGCVPVVIAGVGGGALAAEDRRSIGAQAEDKSIYVKAESAVNQLYGDRVHVNVTSFNRKVLLTGEVPDAATKAGVEKAVGTVENVASVVNELKVGGIASLTSRTNDSVITSKVKGNMVDNRDMQANRYKVVTEASTVYLMGLVTREEGDLGATVASRTSGVSRVVKVFDYVQPAPETEAARKAREAREQKAKEATTIGGTTIRSPDYSKGDRP